MKKKKIEKSLIRSIFPLGAKEVQNAFEKGCN